MFDIGKNRWLSRSPVIAALVILTLLGWKVPPAQYPLLAAGVAWCAGVYWNSWKSPDVSAWGLLFFAALCGVLPIVWLARLLLTGPHYRGAELAELLFNRLTVLPIGVCSAVSLIRFIQNKHGRDGQEKG